jgi:type I restriction enzyme S subunit
VIVRPKKGNNNRFLAYIFDSKEYRTQIRYAVKGVKVFSITQAILRNTNLCLPTLVEQQKIANFLDHETAKIDTLIEKQQQLIKLLKEKRQAVISHAVTKGLNPNAPLRDSGVEWLGEVPEHWEVVPLKYLCHFSGGGTPSKDNLNYWTGGDIPWVSPKDMKTFFISTTQDKLTETAVQESSTNYVDEGALLIVVRSGILQRKIPIAINTVRVTLNQDMKALRFNKLINVQYVANLILGNQDSLLLEWSKEGATVESIEHEYLSNTLFPVPPINEQLTINKSLKKRMDSFQELEKQAKHATSLLKERRTALISAAVTGKIDVRNWQVPNNTT